MAESGKGDWPLKHPEAEGQMVVPGQLLGWIIHRADGTVEEGWGPFTIRNGDQVSYAARFTVPLD